MVFHGVGYFDTEGRFSARAYYQVLATPAVPRAQKYILQKTYIHSPLDGVGLRKFRRRQKRFDTV